MNEVTRKIAELKAERRKIADAALAVTKSKSIFDAMCGAYPEETKKQIDVITAEINEIEKNNPYRARFGNGAIYEEIGRYATAGEASEAAKDFFKNSPDAVTCVEVEDLRTHEVIYYQHKAY